MRFIIDITQPGNHQGRVEVGAPCDSLLWEKGGPDPDERPEMTYDEIIAREA